MMLLNTNEKYLELIVFLVLSCILSIFLLLLSYTLSHKKKNETEKLSAYECGFDPFGNGCSSFEVHFYVVGVLFIIFDLEILFLYPWAIHLGVLGVPGFCGAMSFLGILTVGFIYEWKKGALDWSVSRVDKTGTALLPIKAKRLPPKVEISLFTGLVVLSKKNINVMVYFLSFCFISTLYILVGFVGDIIVILLVALFFLIFSGAEVITLFGRRMTLCYRHWLFTHTLALIAYWVALDPRWGLFGSNDPLFSHEYYLLTDFYTVHIKYYLFLCTGAFLQITAEYLLKYSVAQKINLIEFPLIICFSLFFMLLLVSSFNLFGAYVAIEGLTFSLYILAGMNYNSQNSLEAGMKYFCLGALASGFFLFGVALVFITTKTLDFLELRFLFNIVDELPLLVTFGLIFIFFGFWFKLSIFPCHAWTPDVYEGVLTPVTLFFATVVKLGVFSFLVRTLFFLMGTKVFLFFWVPVFLFVAAGSIVVGGLGALRQTKLKKFIGYTSINQMGYMFIGVSSGDLLGLQASFLYLFFYVITGFTFFAILLYVTDSRTGKDVLFINQLSFFGRQSRNLSFILALALFSMAGLPPLAGFFGKFFLFFSAFKAGNHSLIVLGLVMNVISAFYYLRIVKCLFFEDSSEDLESRGVSYLFCAGHEGFLDPAVLDSTILVFLCVIALQPFMLNACLSHCATLALASSCLSY